MLAFSTGASFTAFTVIAAVAAAVENGVVPPTLVVLTLLPAVPVVLSHARKVMALETVPLKSAVGRKYRRVFVSAASKSAEVSDTVPTAVQFAPPLVE